MKLIQITAKGLPLFDEELELKFYAQQRVAQEDKSALYPLFSNIYLNPTSSFIGVNASGKTSVLRLILFVLNMLNNEPLNHIETRDILGNTNRAEVITYFYSDSDEICKLRTVIISEKNKTEGIRYKIIEEELYSKTASDNMIKKNLLSFDKIAPVRVRNIQEEFLSDDVSIVIAHNKKTKEHIKIASLLQFTNNNVLPFAENISKEIIEFLDPTIENLYFDKGETKTLIHLKFKGKEEIILNDTVELNHYLSSGTIKGIITFTIMQEILQEGGYLVIDEIENHFNREIVATLLRFFMNRKINKNGGVLIFSTHYPELLDEYERNDSIYITRNQNGITVKNLCTILKRNDIKKSDAYSQIQKY